MNNEQLTIRSRHTSYVRFQISDDKQVKHKYNLSIVNFPLSILLFVFSWSLQAQTADRDSVWLRDEWYFSSDDSSFIDPINFLPPFFKNEALLKRFLRNERFYELRKRYNDTLAIDAIFERALFIAEGDVRHALFISTFAVMDHRTLGVKVPLIGSVYVPLTFENDSLFHLRRTHLPAKVLVDKKYGDKDKLQHFFGSAYLAYSTNSNSITEWIGNLLEIGEERFVLGGTNDERDKLANKKGREFGLRLMRERDLLPSDVLWGD